MPFINSIATQLHQLRTAAGLSQRELAKRVGTSASAICRLEDPNYSGYSISMLQRIAEALNQKIEVNFLDIAKEELKQRFLFVISFCDDGLQMMLQRTRRDNPNSDEATVHEILQKELSQKNAASLALPSHIRSTRDSSKETL